MSIEDKIRNAEPSDWLTEGIPKWQVWLIIKKAQLKARIQMLWIRIKEKE